MSLDLTGALLVSFILSELKPVLARHPRFRASGGEAFETFANLVMARDVSVTIGNLRGESTRLSPDYFLGTAVGRALVAQLDGKPGSFVEWLQEVDPSRVLPAPGMYYLGVDTVDEQTRDVRFVTQALRTASGSVTNADGTVVGVNPEIPLHLVQATDSAIQFERAGSRMWLLYYTEALELTRTDTGAALEPGVDWWLERTVRIPLAVTRGGAQLVQSPSGIINLTILDGAGVPLRKGVDWRYVNGGHISLSAWTAPGEELTAVGMSRVDPREAPLVHPENKIGLDLTTGETLQEDSLLYWTPVGSFLPSDVVTGSDGSIYIKYLLAPGDDLRWEAQAGTVQAYASAKKMEMTTQLVPGLNLALGDLVEVGDQCCILVTQDVSDVYKIYGGKDNVSFDLTVKTNDLNTSSELAGLVKRYLLVEGRNRMESAGVTIFSAPTSYQGSDKDASGTSASHSVVLSVSAAADWEYYEPIINRITAVGLDLVVTEGIPKPKAGLSGRTAFVTSYF